METNRNYDTELSCFQILRSIVGPFFENWDSGFQKNRFWGWWTFWPGNWARKNMIFDINGLLIGLYGNMAFPKGPYWLEVI